MLTTQFKATLGVVFIVFVLGIFIGKIVTIEKDIKELQSRPIAIMPETTFISPTATPEATLTPVKILPKASQSGLVK